MKPAWPWAVGVAGFVLGLCALALHQAQEPLRCPDQTWQLGPRCCGEGQTLEEGRCRGKPARCPGQGWEKDEGCVSPNKQRQIEGGRLVFEATDWEADVGDMPAPVDVPTFVIDAFEVTEKRWQHCVGEGRCPGLALSGEPGLPVTGVTFDEAKVFCAFYGGTLPSYEQHVFAATGATGARYPWGLTGAVCRRAVFGMVEGPCAHGAVGPEVAGMRADGATPTGVHDLAGNVAEWVVGRDGRALVRGGSYRDTAASRLRSWSATPAASDKRSSEVGFRCVYPP